MSPAGDIIIAVLVKASTHKNAQKKKKTMEKKKMKTQKSVLCYK